LNLRESKAKSEELQAEMRTDMRGLEEKLAGTLTICLSKMHETAGAQLAQKERELLMSTNELASVITGIKSNASTGAGA
jgi:hypothetical protein